jgi:hypothetical protein
MDADLEEPSTAVAPPSLAESDTDAKLWNSGRHRCKSFHSLGYPFCAGGRSEATSENSYLRTSLYSLTGSNL